MVFPLVFGYRGGVFVALPPAEEVLEAARCTRCGTALRWSRWRRGWRSLPEFPRDGEDALTGRNMVHGESNRLAVSNEGDLLHVCLDGHEYLLPVLDDVVGLVELLIVGILHQDGV